MTSDPGDVTSDDPGMGDRRGRPGSRRLSGLALAVVVALAVLAVTLVLPRTDEAEAPAPAPEEPADEASPGGEDPPADPPTASPDAGEDPPPPEAVDELVGTVADEVGAIRGLPAREPVDAEVQDADELADTVADLAARDRDPEELEIQRRILVTLRLLPDDLDLEATLEDLLGEQVAGLYSPEEETLYVRADDADDLSPGEEVTLAHEVVHALQDQSFGLERFLELADEDLDAGLAAQSLIEGDALLTQELWSLRHQSGEERTERLDEFAEVDTERLEQAPRYVRESLVFPYQEGLAFVQALHEEGGFEAVDAAFDEPPTASAQIIDPERYVEGDTPADVDIAGTPGSDWAPLGEYAFGAFDLRSLVRESDQGRAAELAATWAGGRVQAWERDEDVALTLALSFVDGAAGAEACTALGQWYAAVADASETRDPGVYEGDRDWAAVRCDGAEVHVGIGPEGPTARSLAGI